MLGQTATTSMLVAVALESRLLGGCASADGVPPTEDDVQVRTLIASLEAPSALGVDR
jgi:hypothetical protein